MKIRRNYDHVELQNMTPQNISLIDALSVFQCRFLRLSKIILKGQKMRQNATIRVKIGLCAHKAQGVHLQIQDYRLSGGGFLFRLRRNEEIRA